MVASGAAEGVKASCRLVGPSGALIEMAQEEMGLIVAWGDGKQCLEEGYGLRVALLARTEHAQAPVGMGLTGRQTKCFAQECFGFA